MSKKIAFLLIFLVAIVIFTITGTAKGKWSYVKDTFYHREAAPKAKQRCLVCHNPLKSTWNRLRGSEKSPTAPTRSTSYFRSSDAKPKCPETSKPECGWKCDLYDKKKRLVNKVCTLPLANSFCCGDSIMKQLKDGIENLIAFSQYQICKTINWICSLEIMKNSCYCMRSRSENKGCVENYATKGTSYKKSGTKCKQQMQKDAQGYGGPCPLERNLCSGVPLWKRAKEMLLNFLCFLRYITSRIMNSIHSRLTKCGGDSKDTRVPECIRKTTADLKKNKTTDIACKRSASVKKSECKLKQDTTKVMKKPCQIQAAKTKTKRRHKECPYCGCGMSDRKRACKPPFVVQAGWFTFAFLSALLLHLAVLPLISTSVEQ